MDNVMRNVREDEKRMALWALEDRRRKCKDYAETTHDDLVGFLEWFVFFQVQGSSEDITGVHINMHAFVDWLSTLGDRDVKVIQKTVKRIWIL